MKGGLLKRKQWKILQLRAKGFTQLETAKKLGMSRANISMIEFRAKKKLERARESIQIYEALRASNGIAIDKRKAS
jgi:HTH-type transcriptional regulator, fmd operon transcriptional regulator